MRDETGSPHWAPSSLKSLRSPKHVPDLTPGALGHLDLASVKLLDLGLDLGGDDGDIAGAEALAIKANLGTTLFTVDAASVGV